MAYVCISYSTTETKIGRSLTAALARRGHAVFVSALDAEEAAEESKAASAGLAAKSGATVHQLAAAHAGHQAHARADDKITLLVSDPLGGTVFEKVVDPRTDADVRAVVASVEDMVADAREAQEQEDEIRRRQEAATVGQKESRTLNWGAGLFWNSAGILFLVIAAFTAIRIAAGLQSAAQWSDFWLFVERALLQVGPFALCAAASLALGRVYMASAQQCGDRIWALVPKDLPEAAKPQPAAAPAA